MSLKEPEEVQVLFSELYGILPNNCSLFSICKATIVIYYNIHILGAFITYSFSFRKWIFISVYMLISKQPNSTVRRSLLLVTIMPFQYFAAIFYWTVQEIDSKRKWIRIIFVREESILIAFSIPWSYIYIPHVIGTNEFAFFLFFFRFGVLPI